MIKTVVKFGIAVAAGGLGAWLLLQYCKKKKKCGCGCSGDATAATTPATTPVTPPIGPGILPVASTPPIMAPGAASALAADGKKTWVKQPKQWH